MKKVSQQYDLVVCGGGLAGFCAAVAAARQGVKTCLVQDRPVLGGNSSSEVKVSPHGAAGFHAYGRETGIISEVLIEERARNHEAVFENGWMNSVWDMVLYDVAQKTPTLKLHLNTSITAVVMAGGARVEEAPLPQANFGYLHRPACNPARRIEAVVGRVANAETELTLSATHFIDCTGDGLVADLAGCEWRMGSEGRDEFGEMHAPAKPSKDTMGNSIHFRARDMGRPMPYTPPEWAIKHTDARYFYEQGRKVDRDIRAGYWWLEIGVPWDTIYNSEDIRHELTRHTLGVWDWIKNHDPRTKDLAANYALDWIGQVPGKRESRRIMGQYLMTENDVQNRKVFSDEVAFGGWFLDLHTPGGLLAPSSEPATVEGYNPTSDYAHKSYMAPYGIPLSILIAKDLDNLMMAGRNVSVSRAALGTVRVMGTTALMGQAVGIASARALKVGKSPSALAAADVAWIQQQLIRDDCFLPNTPESHPQELVRGKATISASSEDLLDGAIPDEKGHHEGLSFWVDQAMKTGRDELLLRRGQLIAVATDRIDELSVCLSNFSSMPQEVTACLVPVDNIWDYRSDPDPVLAQSKLVVPPGEKNWVKWKLGVAVKPGTYVRLDLGANKQVAWLPAGRIVPGHYALFDMGKGRMRRYGHGVTMSYLIAPAQPSFGPGNIATGVGRPYRFTNLWCSAAKRTLPQWIVLEWAEDQKIKTIDLTFPGNMLREYCAYGALYLDPQCPRDYAVEVPTGDGWSAIFEVSGNFQRRRRHQLERPVSTRKIRIKITATNGDPRAAIYGVRCYPD